MRSRINSSNQVKMSVCHRKDNGRNPFLAPCCCTHVWNYPQGKIFAWERTFIGLRCDWLHKLCCQLNWFWKPNKRPHKSDWKGSGGTACTWWQRQDTEQQGPWLLLLSLTKQCLEDRLFPKYLNLRHAMVFWYGWRDHLVFWLGNSLIYFLCSSDEFGVIFALLLGERMGGEERG